MTSDHQLYLMLLSVHGLVRARNPELGRDADTGGQILYVLDLAKALIRHPGVGRVDVVTRLIEDPRVDSAYAQPREEVARGVTIVRLPFGPRRYLRKESLWPHLDALGDNLVHYLRSLGEIPDLFHGHYADAGQVATRLASLIDAPMAFTGHSLGRVKQQRLLAQGMSSEAIEKRYRITQRIEAEETALSHASFVIASTHQEVHKQYELYDYYQPKRMLVVPPGVDLGRFSPPTPDGHEGESVLPRVAPFLRDPDKPLVLAIARADRRKNLASLLHAFGRNEELRNRANLVIIAGNRDDIEHLDKGAREVLSEMLHLVDRYNLYGSVAYPKQHGPDEVPAFYRLAAGRKGVFVNPALTEPFGLTLLEAAASGLPVVATDDGGPRDILGLCENGVLIDPLDVEQLGRALLDALADEERWEQWSRNGIEGARQHFSWESHADKYLRTVQTAIERKERRRRVFGQRRRLISSDRILICDIDGTLVGDEAGLIALLDVLKGSDQRLGFGIATGRNLELTLSVLEQWKVPPPNVLITSVGTAIRYGRNRVEDRGWERRINYRWRPDGLRKAMQGLPGIELQPAHGQTRYKVSYDVDPSRMPPIRDIRAHLRRERLHARVVYSHGAYLDLIPIRASKGNAIRYFCLHWGIPPERCLVAGDSGNDKDMLQ
ncbi:MAG: HAD-IIB family hydrolase, partial [Planctomycetota bacterium]